MQLTGAQILVQSLLDQGVDVLFGYPGGTVLNIYDALYEKRDALRHVLVAHEQGAAHAADGYARSTGRTGVCLATSGPGATNLVTGIATAYLDSVPLVAITGNVPRDLIGRDSFQEADIVSITTPIVKHNYQVRDVGALAATVREAFELANSGRKGPVLIDIPKDITAQTAEHAPLPRFEPRPNAPPDGRRLALAAKAITASKHPLIYCGGGVTFSDSAAALARFAERIQAPVCVSMMGLTSMPADTPMYLGLVGMHGTATANYAVGECDLLIAVGARFSDRVAGNRTAFAKNAQVLHIDIDQAEMNKNIEADIALAGHAADCLDRLCALLSSQSRPDWVRSVLRHKALNAMPVAKSEGEDINPREVIRILAELAGPEAVVVTDVGQHQMLTAQYYPFTRPRSFLSSCGFGAMGYGMGAAIGAAIGNPERRVALFTGDGSFHMNLHEMATAVSQSLPLVIVVMNNRVLGMVHQWQSLFYSGRYSCTEPDRRTDFVALAKAFGAKGLRLDRPEDIRAVLTKAFRHKGGPCVVDCRIPPTERVFPIVPPGGAAEDALYYDN